MKIKTYKVSIILYLLLNVLGYSQNSQNSIQEFTPQIAPPSPNAFQFTTFGNIPFNGSTGAFSYSIPLIELNQNEIKLPISANYSSNGVNVDKLSGIIGIDWNLSVGGIVSRVAKGLPDDRATVRWYPQQPVNLESSTTINGIWEIAEGIYRDSEPDWFSFNVNGISGNFYLDENLNPLINSDSPVKVEFTFGAENSPYGNMSTFTIIDSQGIKYIFGGSENFLEGNMSSRDCFVGPKDWYYSAWYLKKIITPKNQIINFTYEENNITYFTNTSYNLNYTQRCEQPYHIYNYSYSDCRYFNDMKSKVISSIQFNGGNVQFSYENNRLDGGGKKLKNFKLYTTNNTNPLKIVSFNYEEVLSRDTFLDPNINTDTSLKYRTFLKDITIQSGLYSDTKNRYSFEYIEKNKLPYRLSYSKDIYGFNNGTNNIRPFNKNISNIFPLWDYMQQSGGTSYAIANLDVNPNNVFYGMLNKIIYPTKGHTIIEYEANSDLKLEQSDDYNHQELKIDKGCNNIKADPVEFTFVSNGTPINFTAVARLDEYIDNCPPVESHQDYYYISIYENNVLKFSLSKAYGINSQTDVNKSCLNEWYNQFNGEPICTDSGKEYRVVFELGSKFGPAWGRLNIRYNRSNEMIEKPIYGAGARVKKIIDYSEDYVQNIREFFYNKFNEYPSDNTTMTDVFEPRYYQTSTIVMGCPSLDPYTPPSVWFDAPKFTVNSSSIDTQYVNRTSTANYTTITEILGNSDDNLGAIQREYKLIYDHQPNHLLGFPIYGTAQSNFSSNFYFDKLVNEVYFDKLRNEVKKTNYEYEVINQGLIPGFVGRKNYDLPNDVWLPEDSHLLNYSASYYFNYYGVIKLKSINNVESFANGNLTNEKYFYYGSSPYFNLESETLTNSDGKTYVTNYTYAPDLIGIEQAPYMQNLTDANRVSEPVITETFVKEGVINKKLSETHIKYANDASTGNLLLPKEIHSSKGTGNINITTIENRKVTYTKYSINGNIMEYKLEDGTPVSIIWGYDEQYPIAKVEGKTYVEIQSLADVLILDSNSSWGLQPSNFNNLRALEGALVTSYIYKPLVGVTSITMPNGSTEYYEYDEMGRLKEVKNSQGEVIRKMEYHYKPN